MTEPGARRPKGKVSGFTIVLALLTCAACAGVLMVFAIGFGHQG